MNGRSLFLIIAILMTTAATPAIWTVKADIITFTESVNHHVPWVRWAEDPLILGGTPFASGYLSPTAAEEALYWEGGLKPSCKWTAEATKITVSFPDTPDPSVVGADNWLGAGMFVQGQDESVNFQDYGYYTILVLDSGGNLWLDVGGYRAYELTGSRALMFDKTWQIQGLSWSTPVTLTAAWNASGFIVWHAVINEVSYQLPNAFFNMRLYEPTAKESFYVGWANTFPMNAPYFTCYYFQFGISCHTQIAQGGWNVFLEDPQYYRNGGWHITQQARTMQGAWAYLDSMFTWGGENCLVSVECYKNNRAVGRYRVKFFRSAGGSILPDYYLWRHEPLTPLAPLGEDYGFINREYIYALQGATDPEGDMVIYQVAWGDGTYSISAWGSSGWVAFLGHSWSSTGYFDIQVRAQDLAGELWSDWSTWSTILVMNPPPIPPPPWPGGGGCPWVSAWNGTEYAFDNNLIPAAEHSNGTDVMDYYILQQSVARDEGKDSLLISDTDKNSFLDRVQLLAVDHKADVNVAVSPYGEVLTYKNPANPITAISQGGENLTSVLGAIDGQYYEGYEDDYVTLDFGDLDTSNGAKLVLRTDPLCDLNPCKESIHVLISNATGYWSDVARFIPRIYWATDIINLSSYLPDANGDLKVRLYFTATHRVDYVGLDTTAQAKTQQQYANLATANHSRLGDVKDLFKNSDNLRVELLPGDCVTLQFTAPQLKDEKRDFIIILEGHYFIIN